MIHHFSCHTLRHTFTTRLIESGMNVKVIQEALGHSDIQTTLNIYADVTKELKKQQFAHFDDFIAEND
ncbi:tyrosine-type recombinase/integrase [Limosilactobacillus vaginalis]|uniref:tyrosine-type recombinase/integrase n=1 Tax=Limosilactobacillus vaginalis TaxID=1633 RepID=UPI000F51A5A0